MKKEISMLLCGTMIAGMLAGCGAGSGGSSGTSAASESTPAVSVSETSAAADSSTGGKHKVGYNYLGAGAYSLATLANNEKKVWRRCLARVRCALPAGIHSLRR